MGARRPDRNRFTEWRPRTLAQAVRYGYLFYIRCQWCDFRCVADPMLFLERYADQDLTKITRALICTRCKGKNPKVELARHLKALPPR